jgi:uncharacterized membrane protein YphA (DoxX/SURF4 family)
MTIWNLLIGFAIGGGILTAITGLFLKAHKNWLFTFLQNFTGVWFIFSGAVKAVDPWGTAFKMQQYFGEFENTFKGTSAKFIAPIFPWLADYALGFSIFMITLEIIVGLMLILGHKTKLTSWLFLIIMAFFTVLTGYTHFTAFVPDGVNFFEFSKWGEYVETNMKVTDCGCFGDFLKLSPTTSFYKDIALMPIALLFVFKNKQFHALFSNTMRIVIIAATLIGTLAFSLYNTYQNEPVVDFRPFKNGVNVREQKKAEEDAASAVKITDWLLKNEKTGELKTVTNTFYMDEKGYEQYKKEDGWGVLKQIKTDPSVPHSKISDFGINDKDGNDVSEALLSEPKYTFLIVSWKMPSETIKKTITVPDSIFRKDTVRMKIAGVDTFEIKKVFEKVGQREEVFKSFQFNADYRNIFTLKLNPLLEQAEKAGYKIGALVPYSDPKKIEDFRHEAQAAYTFYTADDLLIKTMMRSNPGLYLLKNGLIVQKWHIKQLPDFETIKAQYIK